MTTGPAPAASPMSGSPGPSRWATWVGILVGALCLVWVFHDVDARAVWRGVTSVRWPWVALAIGGDVLGYVCQGLRWWLLLPREGRPGVIRTTQAIYAGLCTNELLPVRPGELVRAWLVSRWSGAPLARVVSSIVIERLMDGVWLAAGIALVLLLVPLPAYLVEGEEVLGIVVAIGVTSLVILRWRLGRLRTEPAGGAAPRGWRATLGHLAAASTSDPGAVAKAFVVSSLVPFFEAVALWCVMRAYGIELPLSVGIAVLLIVRLGTALPNAPGNLGTYQFLCVVAVTRFGVGKTAATAFSIGAFVLLTVPLLVLGLVALARSGIGLTRLRREVGAILGQVPSSRTD